VGVRTRQVVVPLVAAALGSGITAAAMSTGGSTGATIGRQQGLLTSSVGAQVLNAEEIYQQAAPSVVHVSASTVQGTASAFDSQTGGQLALSTGSGFVLDDDGRVVTSAHVISGVTAVQVTFADGRGTVPAHVLGKDEEADVAVLAVDPDGLDLRPLELGDSSLMRPGDQVIAVGNPTGVQPTAGTGRIAAAHQRIEAPGGYVIDDVFATDAVIEPATSGGPLVSPDGRVIGITSRIEGSTGFAVPSNIVRDAVERIKQGTRVIRPYIGLTGTGTDGGVQVTDVHPDGPADRAGLQEDDLIETIDDQPLTSFMELLAEVDRHAPGDTVTLQVLRNGSRGPVPVQLEERPATLAAG
jgi:putative serine protease PepD